jgi:uncharacterized protein YgbK (DUF1537 family)
MIKLLIIADDLTGALDAGVHFTEKGIATEVIPVFNRTVPIIDLAETVEVIVVNTESRHLPAEEAASQVAFAVGFGMDHGARFIYKKTDSTLRGNIGSELEALMKTAGVYQIPFIPAYPALGRFTKEGFHYIGHQLLHQTRFAEDPLEPINNSYIPEILGRQTSCKINVVPLPFESDFYQKESKEREIFVFDCSSDLDLAQIGDVFRKNKQLTVVAGSAAIASFLAGMLSFSEARTESSVGAGNCLIVNGSLNHVSIEQIEILEKTSLNSIILDPEFLDSDVDPHERWTDLISVVKKKMEEDPNLLISSSRSSEDLMRYLFRKYNSPIPKDVFSRAAHRFAHFIAKIPETIDIGVMIIVGGDTLMALVKEMGITSLHPVREILSGVVLSWVEMRNRSLYLITKPGGYGEKDTLLRIVQNYKNRTL